MSNYVAAAPGTYLLGEAELEGNRVAFDYHPVIAWGILSGDDVRPVTLSGAEGVAILLPTGEVMDLKSQKLFPTETAYAASKGMVLRDAKRAALAASQEPAGAPRPATGGKAPSLRELGISGRACAPLERMKVITLADLAKFARDDIAAVKGVSTESVAQMDAALQDAGLAWGGGSSVEPAPEPEPEQEPEDDDDDVAGVL